MSGEISCEIIPASAPYFKSFHEALSAVARERIFIEMTEAPPPEQVAVFQAGLIARGAPVVYAVCQSQVVGWCDITPKDNPRHSHRGSLGMGIVKEFRGRGLGARLMEAALAQAVRFGLEKVELQVYTTNTAAIALYKKFGFEQEGLIRKYRRLDGRDFDCLAMAKFL